MVGLEPRGRSGPMPYRRQRCGSVCPYPFAPENRSNSNYEQLQPSAAGFRAAVAPMRSQYHTLANFTMPMRRGT